MQNDVENTAGFTGLDHIGGEIVEDHGILAHGIRQGRAPFHRGADAVQSLLERGIFLVGGQDFQALNQGQPSVDHDRELAEENGDILGLDLPRTKGGHGEFFAFFPHRPRRDALAPQLLQQHVFVSGNPLAAYLLARCALSRKCKDWHGDSLLTSTCNSVLWLVSRGQNPPQQCLGGAPLNA